MNKQIRIAIIESDLELSNALINAFMRVWNGFVPINSTSEVIILSSDKPIHRLVETYFDVKVEGVVEKIHSVLHGLQPGYKLRYFVTECNVLETRTLPEYTLVIAHNIQDKKIAEYLKAQKFDIYNFQCQKNSSVFIAAVKEKYPAATNEADYDLVVKQPDLVIIPDNHILDGLDLNQSLHTLMTQHLRIF